MNFLRRDRQIDQLGVQQYRTGTMFYASYAMLFLGLLFFDWDPRFVFLGLTIEFALGVLGNIVRTFISPGGGAALIAILLQLPSLAPLCRTGPWLARARSPRWWTGWWGRTNSY